jgi:hypothetical protein
MSTIKYPITEAATIRTHCDAIAAHAAVLKDVITGDPTGDTATTALSAIRHSLDELEAYAEQRRQENSEQRDDTPYKHVYFRLDSGYVWGEGMGQNKTENFYSDILALFAAEGWTITQPYRNGSGATVANGNSSLYIHPQAVSGYVTEELIPAVSAALEHGCTFQHYATDIYETAYNWTAQQYRDYLNSKRGDINAALLEAFKTPRRNLYKFDYNALPVVISKFHVQRLDGQNGHCTGDITEQVIREMFTALVNTGKIDQGETKNGTAYRTAPRRRT